MVERPSRICLSGLSISKKHLFVGSLFVAGELFVRAAQAEPPPDALPADPPVSISNDEPHRNQNNATSAGTEADEAYRRATEFIAWGLLSDALPSLERAATLHPHSQTTFMMGICERGLGHDTRARKLLNLALKQYPELSRKDRTTAMEVLETLSARLARLHVTLSQPQATILVDGRPLERDNAVATTEAAESTWVAGVATNHAPASRPAGRFYVLLDPGTHRIDVVAPGFEPATREYTFIAGESFPIVMKLEPSRRRAQYTQPTLANVLIFVGGVGVVTGVGTLFYAVYAKDMAAQHCSKSWACTAEGRKHYENAQVAARAATVVIPMSLIFGSIPGAILFLSDQRTARSNSGRNWAVNLNVVASDRHVEAGLVFAGSF